MILIKPIPLYSPILNCRQSADAGSLSTLKHPQKIALIFSAFLTSTHNHSFYVGLARCSSFSSHHGHLPPVWEKDALKCVRKGGDGEVVLLESVLVHLIRM